MKRKSAARTDSQLMLEKSVHIKRRDTAAFTGYVTQVAIRKAKQQAMMRHEEHAWRIIDDNYTWKQFFPEHSASTVTLMLNEQDSLIIRYIDICLGHGVDPETGIPWYDDLYLDIVVTPEGTVHLLDEDELDEALQDGKITPEQHAFAWQEARRILQEIEQGTSLFLAVS